MTKTIEARFIKFRVPLANSEKGKTIKFLHIQILTDRGTFFPKRWEYLMDERPEFDTVPKVVSDKEEGIEFIRKQSGVRDEQLSIMLHPSLSKI